MSLLQFHYMPVFAWCWLQVSCHQPPQPLDQWMTMMISSATKRNRNVVFCLNMLPVSCDPGCSSTWWWVTQLADLYQVSAWIMMPLTLIQIGMKFGWSSHMWILDTHYPDTWVTSCVAAPIPHRRWKAPDCCTNEPDITAGEQLVHQCSAAHPTTNVGCLKPFIDWSAWLRQQSAWQELKHQKDKKLWQWQQQAGSATVLARDHCISAATAASVHWVKWGNPHWLVFHTCTSSVSFCIMFSFSSFSLV